MTPDTTSRLAQSWRLTLKHSLELVCKLLEILLCVSCLKGFSALCINAPLYCCSHVIKQLQTVSGLQSDLIRHAILELLDRQHSARVEFLQLPSSTRVFLERVTVSVKAQVSIALSMLHKLDSVGANGLANARLLVLLLLQSFDVLQPAGELLRVANGC